MPRPRAFDEARVLDEAMRAFWEQGYGATSIDDLTERTGLSRSSIYQAFGSKRRLFDAAIARYLDAWFGPTLHELETGSGGLDDVTGFFARLAAALDDPAADPRLGCLVVNSIGELAWRDDGLRRTGESYRGRLHLAFLAALGRARRRGELSEGSPEDRARVLVALTLGLFVTERGNPEVEDARLLARAVAAQVDGWRIRPRNVRRAGPEGRPVG
jgi:TetR/AcrR family transcriptional repressor of nem operon